MHPETISRILPGIKTNYLDSIREESSNLSRSPSHEENPISQQNDSHHHT